MSRRTRLLALPCLLLSAWSAAAAPLWGPGDLDLEARPRTLLRSGEVEIVRGRLDRQPYLDLLVRVQQQADRDDPLDDHSVSNEQRKFNTAKCAAFLYALDRRHDGGVAVPFTTPEAREAMGRHAEARLLALNTDTRLTDINTSQLDIHVGQELHGYAVAYDLLAGAGFPFAEGATATIERNLWLVAADLHDAYERRFKGVAEGGNENHATKTAAGLGFAAIVLNGAEPPEDWPAELPFSGPEDWIKLALERTDRILAFGLTDLDGGYTEAGVYHRYSAIDHLPWMRTLHNYVDGRELEVDGVSFPDFWTDPWIVDQLDWLLRIRVPDGTIPPHDDCTPDETYMWGTVTELPHGSHYRWAWEESRRPYDAGGSVEQACDSLVTFDDAIVPAPPPWEPSQFLEHAGIAIFRSDWGPDATFFAVQAEHGSAAGYCHRRWGLTMEGCGGHDHNDPGSFMLWWGGGWLALDAGYLGWDNHNKVNNDHNHNIVLVNGKGPKKSYLTLPELEMDEEGNLVPVPGKEGGYMPGGDGVAYLTRYFDHGSFAFAEVETSYFMNVPETTIRRRFVWYKPWDVFFVVDDVEAVEPADLAVHLHGNGGGDTSEAFTLLDPTGAEWTTPDGNRLQAHFASTHGTPTVSAATDIHDGGHWEEKVHATATATLEEMRSVFLTALLPAAAGVPWPTVEAISTDEPGIEGQRAASVTLTRPGDETLLVSAGVDPFLMPGTEQRASLLVASTGMTAPLLIDGSPIGFPDLLLVDDPLTRAAPLTIAVDSLDAPVTGYAVGGPATIRLKSAVEPGVVAGLCAASRDGDWLVLELPPVPHAYAVSATPGNAEPVAATAAKLSGNIASPTPLDATPSCDADGDGLTYRWEVLKAPYLSTAQPADPAAASTTFTPDRYGVYRLELTVSDGTAEDSIIVVLHADVALPEPEVEEVAEEDAEPDAEPDLDAEAEPDLDQAPEVDAADLLEEEESTPATDENDSHGCGCAI